MLSYWMAILFVTAKAVVVADVTWLAKDISTQNDARAINAKLVFGTWGIPRAAHAQAVSAFLRWQTRSVIWTIVVASDIGTARTKPRRDKGVNIQYPLVY